MRKGLLVILGAICLVPLPRKLNYFPVWEKILEDVTIDYLAISRGVDKYIYAFSQWTGDGFYRSTNNYFAWQYLRFNEIGYNGQLKFPVVDRKDPRRLLVPVGPILYISTNLGESFQQSSDYHFFFWPYDEISQDDNGIYYCVGGKEGAYCDVYLLISNDKGQTWTAKQIVYAGIGINITSFGVCASSPETLYVTGYNFNGNQQNFILKSVDGGDNWERCTTAGIHALFAFPDDPKRVITVNEGGIFLSQDGGKTWEKKATGNFWFDEKPIGNYSDPDEVFAYTQESVFYSYDRGLSFVQFNQGLEGSKVKDLALNENDRLLYCATDRGVFRILIPRTLPPSSIQGERKFNRALFSKEYIDEIRWENNAKNINVTETSIYQVLGDDYKYLASVPYPNQQYSRRNVDNSASAKYLIICENAQNERSLPALLEIPIVVHY